MEKTRILNLDCGAVTVKKLALGDYATLLRSIKKLPSEIAQFIDENEASKLKDMNLKKFLPEFLPMLADSMDEFCAVLAVATDKDARFFIEEVDLADATDVLVAALELNDYSRVVTNIKKITARKATTTEADQVKTPPQTETVEQPTTT